MQQAEYEQLNKEQRIVVTTSSQLVKHLRGLESAGILKEEATGKLIGCVKLLKGIAEKGAEKSERGFSIAQNAQM